MTDKTGGSAEFAGLLALAAVSCGAIRLNPDDPFTWASGYRMPIYNDNRLFLYHPGHRDLIAEAFVSILREKRLDPDIICGIPSAGIPWGTLLADRLKKPFIYVRREAKDHGRRKSVEGLDDISILAESRVLVVEDLISTGKSSLESIEQLLELKADVPLCLSIFSYGFPEAKQKFENRGIDSASILDFPALLSVLEREKYFDADQIRLLSTWNSDPFAWGQANGFPKI